MALFKYVNALTQSQEHLFDATYQPGMAAPHPGIYRCISCGNEIALLKGNAFPPEDHERIDLTNGKVGWKLLVCPVSR